MLNIRTTVYYSFVEAIKNCRNFDPRKSQPQHNFAASAPLTLPAATPLQRTARYAKRAGGFVQYRRKSVLPLPAVVLSQYEKRAVSAFGQQLRRCCTQRACSSNAYEFFASVKSSFGSRFASMAAKQQSSKGRSVCTQSVERVIVLFKIPSDTISTASISCQTIRKPTLRFIWQPEIKGWSRSTTEWFTFELRS
ncbi:hypothetical protein NPIL_563611 [Nephila pilipes]|uniref:Uncharacterized protein n=1 Tax=Nephila pilipes TaxID=299642 RepID=A0A8X6N827_NEPPI|nr:hypothetical protein NPIL_563611 [Nephila pilipes]